MLPPAVTEKYLFVSCRASWTLCLSASPGGADCSSSGLVKVRRQLGRRGWCGCRSVRDIWRLLNRGDAHELFRSVFLDAAVPNSSAASYSLWGVPEARVKLGYPCLVACLRSASSRLLLLYGPLLCYFVLSLHIFLHVFFRLVLFLS